jgi:hypothetical protein
LNRSGAASRKWSRAAKVALETILGIILYVTDDIALRLLEDSSEIIK